MHRHHTGHFSEEHRGWDTMSLPSKQTAGQGKLLPTQEPRPVSGR